MSDSDSDGALVVVDGAGSDEQWIERLHSLKLTPKQKELLDSCVEDAEMHQMLKHLLSFEEGCKTVYTGLQLLNLREKVRGIMVIKRFRDRSPDRLAELRGRLARGMRVTEREAAVGERLAFRSRRRQATRSANPAACE